MSRLKPMAPGSAPDRRVALIEDTVVVYSRPEEYAIEITKLWSDAQRKFLLIGRYLIQAKARLEHGEYEKMVRDRLPFAPETARKLRTVAEAIEAGALPADRAPRDYTTAYYIATLEPVERQQAEVRGLIRPDVTRREVTEFRREIRAGVISQPDPPVLLPDTQADELRRLKAELAELDQRRALLIARINELRSIHQD